MHEHFFPVKNRREQMQCAQETCEIKLDDELQGWIKSLIAEKVRQRFIVALFAFLRFGIPMRCNKTFKMISGRRFAFIGKLIHGSYDIEHWQVRLVFEWFMITTFCFFYANTYELWLDSSLEKWKDRSNKIFEL